MLDVKDFQDHLDPSDQIPQGANLNDNLDGEGGEFILVPIVVFSTGMGDRHMIKAVVR